MNSIKMLIMDVDGTLTDGKIHLSSEGEIYKSFDVKDGYGIKHICKKYDIVTVIITGRCSKIVEVRSKELDISEIYQGIQDKKSVLNELVNKYGISNEQIAYIGDDLNDIPAIEVSGLSFAPNDAHPSVKKIVTHVLKSKGGQGAVRECIDLIVKIEEVGA